MILTRKYNLDIVPGGLPLYIRVSRKDTSSTLVFSLFAGKGVLDVPAGTTAAFRGRGVNASASTIRIIRNCMLSKSRNSYRKSSR